MVELNPELQNEFHPRWLDWCFAQVLAPDNNGFSYLFCFQSSRRLAENLQYISFLNSISYFLGWVAANCCDDWMDIAELLNIILFHLIPIVRPLEGFLSRLIETTFAGNQMMNRPTKVNSRWSDVDVNCIIHG